MISEPSKIWVFPKIGEPQNGWFIMENPIKMGWFEGTTVFGNIHMFAESFSGEHNFPEVDQSKFSRKWPWRNICLFCKESVFKRNHPWKETKQKKQPMSKLEHHLSPKNMMTILWLQLHNEMLKHVEHEHFIWCPSYDSIQSHLGPPDRFPHVAAVQIMWSGLKVRKHVGKPQGVLFVTGYFKTIFTDSALKTVRKKTYGGRHPQITIWSCRFLNPTEVIIETDIRLDTAENTHHPNFGMLISIPQ